MIKTNDYVRVVSDGKMKGSGLFRGDRLLVIGTKVAPVTQSDPYLQRIYILTIKVGDEGLLVPNENNDYRAYLVDPRNVDKLPDEEVESIRAMFDRR